MSDQPFVHLHCHSHYSLLDGASPIPKLVARAKGHGMNALALTDHGNLHGALQFYRECKSQGINPIIGYEAYIAPGSRFSKDAGSMKEASYHLTLLAQNQIGFRNLVRMASHASLEGFYFKPRIDKQILEECSEGIICLSGCLSSEFSRQILAGGSAEGEFAAAKETAHWFHKVFGDRYFVEIMNNGVDLQAVQLAGAVDIAREMGLPLVATSDCHYVDREDSEAQDVMLCINTGKFRTDTNRMKMENNEFFLRSPAEMYAHFPNLEEAVARSQQIADSVEIDLELGKRHFPTYKLPENKTAGDYLRELCILGLKDRYKTVPERWNGDELSQEVMQRLDRELGVINKLGFPNYFLIVWDFVREARDQGVPTTARGSGVGALVCFALYLSHVCPIKYDLLFERFLDENRLEAPDIDIDFCKERRGDIIRYVKDKYGEDNVAQIGTFGTLAAKASIKDVGRVLGLPIGRVNQISDMVPEEVKITLKKALDKNEDFRNTYNSDGEVKEVVDLAMKIEGLARNVGTHAAAVVIADKPLTEYVPLCRVSGKTDIITQWSMNDVEDAGLLKMDFLGLKNLTILRTAVDIIEENTGERIDVQEFPLDDEETFALLRRGETKGVFQLESGGIRDLLQKMKPDHFHDIIATAALYRPGPLEGGMVDEYIAVKHKRKKAEYLHPVLEEILTETNGVMVYQEQVMRILNQLGGIPLAKAYTCIKAISKKKEALIAENEEQFMKGAQEKGLSKKEAKDFWEMILKFAGYGFNKCLVADTEVIDADSGRRYTIGEIFQHRPKLRVHSLGDDGKIHKRAVTDVVYNGCRPVFRITTALGRELTATGNHPLRTFEGWTHVDQLAPGDRIAAPRWLEVEGNQTWPKHELITLAGLISEGNTCHPTCLYFYNNDRKLIDDFVEAVQQFPESKARIDVRSQGRFEVCVSTGTDTRIKSDGLSETATMKGLRSGAFRWAERLGILDKRAKEKFVPAELFQLGGEEIALFLGRLWSGDGFVGAAGQMPFYATSSLQLAADVQTLLLRLGVLSRVTTKVMRYRYQGKLKSSTGFTVHLFGDQSVRLFLNKLSPHIIGRSSQLEKYHNYLESVSPATSKDTIPPAVRNLVDRQRQQAGLTWRQLEAESGVSMREFVKKNSQTKRGFRRATISRLANFFESQELREVAESDIYWDRIVSIEPAGKEDVYDLTVEGEHNFVADGLIVHNSHSTAYALIAYQTAYLKAHYPLEFMAALLTGDIPGRNFKRKDSLVEHWEDCQRMNIELVPPSVNSSGEHFIVSGGKIHFGLSAIKGCGGSAAEAIYQDRKKNGPFKDIFDFCERVETSACNRSAIETLIKAGAMDCFSDNRNQLLQVVERAIQSGQSALADKKSGQKNLFGDIEEEATVPAAALPNVPEMEEKEKLMAEKEVLGFYLSSHPLAEYEAKLKTFCTHTTDDIPNIRNKSEVILGGMLSSLKLAHAKKQTNGPTKYAMFDLEDMAGAIRCIVWPKDFEKHADLVKPDAILVARGVVERRGGDEANMIVNELIPLTDLDGRYTTGINVRIDLRKHEEEIFNQVREVVRGYPGKCELRFVVCLPSGPRVHLTSRKYKLDVNDELRRRIDDLLGPGNYQLISSNGKNGK